MSRPYLKNLKGSLPPSSLYIFIALLIGALYLFYLIIRPFLYDVFIAMVLALVFHPLYKRLKKKLRGWEIIPAILTILCILLLFLIPASLLSGVITAQSLELYQKMTGLLLDGSLEKWINQQTQYLPGYLRRILHLQHFRLETYFGKILSTLSEFIYTEMAILAKGIVGTILDSIIVLFICFFLLIDGEKFLKEIKWLSPLEDSHHERIIRQLERTLKATLTGSVIVAVTQGVIGGIGFWIFQIPSAAFWGLCMVFSSVIPLIGTGLIWIPAALYLAFTSSVWSALGLAFWGTILISGADNVLRPLLLKGKANLHPLLTFLSVLGGLLYFGFLGFILGPIVLSFLMTLFDIYKTEFLTETYKEG
jgi:predicted PurR-regulated permease PerM